MVCRCIFGIGLRPDDLSEAVNGLEATRRKQGTDAVHRLPVIALSANAYNICRDQALAAGANLFMAKPFECAVLLGHIDRCLALNWILTESAEDPKV